MRHTRKRQLYNFQKKRNVVFINFEMNHWNSIENSLDKSFKWHRKYNKVSYVNFIRWDVKIK